MAKYLRSGLAEWDGRQFAHDDPRVPLPIRQQVARRGMPGWALYFADTEQGGEWWLFDDAGELIESFWLTE